MIERRRDQGPPHRRRLCYTLGALMASIAVLSLLLTLVAPLMRQGHPSCLTAGQAARWLVARPGAARCADCHQRPLAVMARSLPPSPACPGTTAHAGAGMTSCLSCHQTAPRS